jgi:hypothetical protein
MDNARDQETLARPRGAELYVSSIGPTKTVPLTWIYTEERI